MEEHSHNSCKKYRRAPIPSHCPDTAGNVSEKFTITAKDTLGNETSKNSKTYTMNLNAPTLKVTKTSSTAKGVTYSYTVAANSNKGIVVHLPDGTETNKLNGNVTLTEAGTYAIIVTDAAGHFASENLTVDKTVDGTPPEVRLYPDESSETGNLQVAVGVYEKGSAPTVKLGSTALIMKSEGGGIYSSSFTVTKGGTYTVTATDKSGNLAEASIIVYALVDGSSKTLKLAVDGTYGTLPTPAEKPGYKFDGWYAAKTAEQKSQQAATLRRMDTPSTHTGQQSFRLTSLGALWISPIRTVHGTPKITPTRTAAG